MQANKRKEFIDAVSEAAQSTPLPKPRGRPMPDNLTECGRAKGMSAMRNAPRCCAKRKNGLPCRAPALRGAKRCIKHGGRVEVPEHPHNVRRFLSGEMSRAEQRHKDYMRDRDVWNSMSYLERKELMAMVPEGMVDNGRLLYRAAAVFKETQGLPFKHKKRLWDHFLETYGYSVKSQRG
jgi:hypothetical protein